MASCASKDIILSRWGLLQSFFNSEITTTQYNITSPWEIILNFRAFTNGPFSDPTTPPLTFRKDGYMWGPPIKHHFISKNWVEIVDVQSYSIMLIVCDVLLISLWHYSTTRLISSSNSLFRLKRISPSVRFSIGLLFGVIRLWTIGHLFPSPLYSLMARFCFVLALIFALSALVFDDGPWKALRSNSLSIGDEDSILNPMKVLKGMDEIIPISQKWETRILKKKLESGKSLCILLDGMGEIILSEYSKSMQVRIVLTLLEYHPDRRIVEIVMKRVECKSGWKNFYGYRHYFNPKYFSYKPLRISQKKMLIELLSSLNAIATTGMTSLKFFEFKEGKGESSALSLQRGVSILDEDEDDGMGIGGGDGERKGLFGDYLEDL